MAQKKRGSSKNSLMRISKRVVSTKRHTLGYIVQGKYHTVHQSRTMASKGLLSGVRVVGNHIQAVNGRKRLSDLPTVIQRS